MPLHTLTQNLDLPSLVLGGMLTLLTLAIAIKLYRRVRTAVARKVT